MSEKVLPPAETGEASPDTPEKGERISPGLTGLSAFGAKVLSIPTGMLFIVILTRTLSAYQFGFWRIITVVLAFSLYPAGLISFWTTRDAARGRTIGATALVANLLLSAVGVGAFVGIALLSYGQISVSLYPFLVGTVLVPIGYWLSTAQAVLNGIRPQRFGYVLLSGEFAKLLVVVPALYFLKTGIIGVIFSLGVSNLVQAVLSMYYVRESFSGGLKLSMAGRWLRDSWLPGLITLSYLISIADTLVAAIAFGSTLIAGYYQAAYVVALIVSNAFFLSFALYPLLLKGASEKLVGTLLDVSLMLGVPMAVGISALSYQILFVLKGTYVASSLTLCILAFSTLSLSVSNFLDNSLMGVDTADLTEERNVKKYLRSNLFFVSAVNLGYAVFYVSSVFFLVWLGSTRAIAVQHLDEGWALLQLSFALVMVAIKLRKLGISSVSEVRRPLAVYSGASVAMGVVLYLVTPFFVVYSADAAVYGLRLLALVALGALVYFGLLYSIDRRSRVIFRKVIRLVLTLGPSQRRAPPVRAQGLSLQCQV